MEKYNSANTRLERRGTYYKAYTEFLIDKESKIHFAATIQRNPLGNWTVTDSDVILIDPIDGPISMSPGKIFDSVKRIDNETNRGEIRRIISSAYDAFISDVLNAILNSDCEKMVTDFTAELNVLLEKYQCKLETDTSTHFHLNAVIGGKVVPIAEHDGFDFSFSFLR